MTMRRFRRQRRRPPATTDRRPAEQRLEALVQEKNPERRFRIFTRIRDDLERSSDVIAWIAGISSLRDRLIISESETYYLAEAIAECGVAGEAGDPELLRLFDEILAVEAAGGLSPDETYEPDDAPPEWVALTAEADARFYQIIADRLEAGGLRDLATAYLAEPARYRDRADDGDHRFWPDEDDPDAFD